MTINKQAGRWSTARSGARSWLALAPVAGLALFVASGPAVSGSDETLASAGVAEVARPATRDEALAYIRKVRDRERAERLALLGNEQTPLEREWGIKLLGLNVTAAGYSLDLRYHVLEPRKAAPLLNRAFNFTPYVVVEKSGARLGVPFTEKAGSLRSSVSTTSQIQAGRTYSVLFANPGSHVSAGDRVTVVIGDFVAENVVVR